MSEMSSIVANLIIPNITIAVLTVNYPRLFNVVMGRNTLCYHTWDVLASRNNTESAVTHAP